MFTKRLACIKTGLRGSNAFLVNTKSRIQYQRYLNLNDFISETLIIPDSIIYQYERFYLSFNSYNNSNSISERALGYQRAFLR